MGHVWRKCSRLVGEGEKPIALGISGKLAAIIAAKCPKLELIDCCLVLGLSWKTCSTDRSWWPAKNRLCRLLLFSASKGYLQFFFSTCVVHFLRQTAASLKKAWEFSRHTAEGHLRVEYLEVRYKANSVLVNYMDPWVKLYFEAKCQQQFGLELPTTAGP